MKNNKKFSRPYLYRGIKVNKSVLMLAVIFSFMGFYPMQTFCNPLLGSKDVVIFDAQDNSTDTPQPVKNEVNESDLILETIRMREDIFSSCDDFYEEGMPEDEPESMEDLRYKSMLRTSDNYKRRLTENPQDTVSAYYLGLNDIELCWANNEVDKSYRNYYVCKDIPDYIQILLSSSNPYYYKTGIEICKNAAYALHYHHRLKLKLLEIYTEACLNHDIEPEEDIVPEMERLSTNIQYWDNGHPEQIVYSKYEDRDPIEWSPEYEAVIHLALEKVDKLLRNVPIQMGYCHKYWQTKRSVLRRDYGIEWQDPSSLNTHICYD